MDKCQTCSEIKQFEVELDDRANILVQRVIEECHHIRERNNERWKKFTKLCCLPLIGGLIQKYMVMPRNLESNPDYHHEEWFRVEGKQIEEEARKLEAMKAKHFEHWSDEIVSPSDFTDPGGYYTPGRTSRAECYDLGLKPHVPKKYDFFSAAGLGKFNEERLVMCSSTRRIVPVNNCDWTWTEGAGTRYHLRGC